MKLKNWSLSLIILLLGTVGIAATQFSDVSIKNELTVGTNKFVVSGGNVGQGLTPSASWWNTVKAYSIGRTGNSLFATTNDDDVNLAANAINTGSGTYIYGATDTAALYRQVGGQHVWYRAASGTAGNSITFSEIMRTDTSNNVSIGTTSPTFSNRFTVVGSGGGNSYATVGDGTRTAMVGTNGTDIQIGSYSNHAVRFRTNNADAAYIDTSGNMGVGTTSPAAKFHVNGAVKIGAYTLPSTDGTAGQIPSTNGSGTVSWISKGITSPVIQTFTSGTTFNKPYAFFITSGSATSGATYTHNSVTYTVVQTISSETTLIASGSSAPLTSGTLTKASGTGDSTIMFSSFVAPSALHIRMVGGGGGGAGSAPVSCGPNQGGNNGGATTFGPTGNTGLLTANGGSGGVSGGGNTAAGGAGGTATIGSASGVSGVGHTGAQGGGSTQGVTSVFAAGGQGGSSCFGGAGMGGPGNLAGGTAAANSGSGGGGGGSAGTSGGSSSGAGGGSGACLEAVVAGTTLSSNATFTYAIGAAGPNGGGGCSTGLNGGYGADGKIIVRADYP